MIAKPSTIPSISLLIVEDCKTTLKCYCNILSMVCPEVTVYAASNGATGLEIFKEHLPDIVVTDLNMPEMDGRQMAGNIRAIKPETKLIVITGDKEKLEQEDLAEKEFTFDHIIGKPIDFPSFLVAIKQCNDEIALHGL
jgi:CheY-like chemotaxis protein